MIAVVAIDVVVVSLLLNKNRASMVHSGANVLNRSANDGWSSIRSWLLPALECRPSTLAFMADLVGKRVFTRCVVAWQRPAVIVIRPKREQQKDRNKTRNNKRCFDRRTILLGLGMADGSIVVW
jgi:hypothetical protein